MRYFFLSILLFSAGIATAQTKPERPTVGFRVERSDFQLFMNQLSAQVQGRIGVAATVIETGETVAFRGDERFPMQSVYKFPIGMATLYLADQGVLKANKPIVLTKADYAPADLYSPLRDTYPNGTTVTLDTLVTYAVAESDNSACDLLLRMVGGSAVVTNYLNTLGVNGVIVKHTEREIQASDSLQYQNWATPAEMVKLLRQLQLGRGLSATSRAALLRIMTQTSTGPNRLKGLLPPGTLVAHKTGTGSTRKGITSATNDVGLITLPNGRHLAIAVFVADAKADQATRERAIAQVAKRLWDQWK